MDKNEILKYVDHTLLKQQSTWEEIKNICDDGMKYNVASVSIPASFVKRAKEYVQGKVAICTVIGFPNGNMTTAAKVFETEDAVKNGANYVDFGMFIQTGNDIYDVPKRRFVNGYERVILLDFNVDGPILHLMP